MDNQILADIFDEMADILEIKGGSSDKFRIISYRRGALALRDLEDIKSIAKEGKLHEYSGIGKSIEAKVVEYLKTGKIKKYDELKKIIPKGLIELIKIPSLGPKGVAVLHKELGVNNISDLERAIKKNQIAELPHFGEKSQQNILDGIKRKQEVKDRILLGEVYPVVLSLIKNMKKCKYIKKIEPCGSFRRGKETIGDIDILAVGTNNDAILEHFVALPEVKKIIGRGPTKASVIIKDLGRQVDLRVVKESEFGSAMQYFTGSKQHNIHLRSIAKEKGYKISEYGIFKGSKLVAGKTEDEIYKTLNMQCPAAEMREDTGEIEMAQKNKLPDLVSINDIKGDLHMHSNWSDGIDNIETMVKAAAEFGHEYIAICDHSISQRIAKGLSVSDLKKRNDEIRKLRKKSKIKILIGSEVDILKDGTLDYNDDVLAELDVVVASIHSGFKGDNTDRILKALKNKHVKIIAHPSGRLIGKRSPYEYDISKIVATAKDNNKALEINSHYVRLDLNERDTKIAAKNNCLISINTDSHNHSSFWMIDMGVKIARRGWTEKKNVINGWDYKKLYEWLWEGR